MVPDFLQDFRKIFDSCSIGFRQMFDRCSKDFDSCSIGFRQMFDKCSTDVVDTVRSAIVLTIAKKSRSKSLAQQ